MQLIDLVTKHAGQQIATDSEGAFIYWGSWQPVPAETVAAAQAEFDELELDELADSVRDERNRRLKSVIERIQRYQLQREAGLPTDDDEVVFQSLLEQAQALRDVPQQAGFPENVEWPVEPIIKMI